MKLFLFLLLMSSPILCHACKCATRSANAEWRDAAAIGSGVVQSSRLLQQGEKELQNVRGWTIVGEVKVEEVLKGSVSSLAQIRSVIDKEFNCSLAFVPGFRYMFVVEKDGYVNWCSTISLDSNLSDKQNERLKSYRRLAHQSKQR